MKTYFWAIVVIAYTLTACTHTHAEDNHNHQHSHDEQEAHPAHGSDIIHFSNEQAAKTTFAVQEIQPKDFQQVLKVSGKIMSSIGDESLVVANSNGIVSFISSDVVEGSRVSRNQNLFKITSHNIGAGDYFTKVKVAYETAKANYERAASLVKDQIVSRQEYEEARLAYNDSKMAYDAIAGNYTKNGVAIKSGMSGIIKEMIAKEGEYVTVGQPLAVISQNERLTLRAEVSQRYYADLKNVSSANFKTPYDNKVYALNDLNGKLLSWGKTSNTNSFYVPVTFEFDNNGSVIPGSFVEIYLLSRPFENALAVPVSALTNDMGNYFVYIQTEDEHYRKQEVELGINNGLEVQIVKGLKAGDKVVTQGASQVKMASFSGAIPSGCNHSH